MDQVDSVPDKWAVLIGVEYYEHPEQPTATPRHDGRGNKIEYETLLGCVNDVFAVEQYLVDTIKAEPKHMKKPLAPSPGRKYLSQLPVDSYRDPSYDNMVDALKVPEGAKEGDFIYIHFSGQGARATTVFPELKDGGADAEDGALVPSDITHGGNYLRDLDMGILLQAMVDAGLIVAVVLDCCHSGGAIRGDNDPELGGVRGVPENIQVESGGRSTQDHRQYRALRTAAVVDASSTGFLCPRCVPGASVSQGDDREGQYPRRLTYWLLKILRNSPLGRLLAGTLRADLCQDAGQQPRPDSVPRGRQRPLLL